MAKAKKVNVSTDDPQSRPGNLADKVSLKARLIRWAAALGLGILSSVIFAPIEWTSGAWLLIAPLLIFGLRYKRGHLLMGYLWGLGHYVFTLVWLKEIFFLAPFGVALVCAAYPAIWLLVCSHLYRNLRFSVDHDLEPQADERPRADAPLSLPRRFVFLVLAASAWVALEWVRSWLFTGFPWNLLGVSQWHNLKLIQLSRFTGVYGISFVIVLVNIGIFLAVKTWQHREKLEPKARIPWPLGAAVLLALIASYSIPPVALPPPQSTLKVACIQGNIPQVRVPEKAMQIAYMSVDVYKKQSIMAAANNPNLDLIVWPETAVPWPLYEPHPLREGKPQTFLSEVVDTTGVPMIVGTIDYISSETRQDELVFNSAVHVATDTSRISTYDKIHIVPFGEFLPFERYWPKRLREMDIFMRSIEAGNEATLFTVDGAEIGLNICYEDVFPEISWNSVRRGANLLLTITNDAWYNETSGSHQHMTHAVFRAVEMARPMLRNGNNSDTCMILPNGRVTGCLVNPQTRSSFYRGYGVYDVPVYAKSDLPLTFYARHGNVFALVIVAIAIGGLGWCIYRSFHRRQRILAKLEK